MKKFVSSAMLILAFGSFVNAQIKVVGDDYSETLSATKNYYEKDLFFDSLFPRIDFKEEYKVLWAWTNILDLDSHICLYDIYDYSLLGDTFYIPKDFLLTKWNWNNTTQFGSLSFVLRYSGESVSSQKMVPSGYYVIYGYVFCNGGTLRNKYTGESRKLPPAHYHNYSSSDQAITDEERVKKAKDCFLVNEQKLKEVGISGCLQYDYLVLKSISDTNIFFYCRGLHDQIIHNHSSNSDNYFRFLNVEFYTEFKNNFVGKEVSIIKNGGFRQDYYPSYKCYPRGLVSYQNSNFFDGNSNRDSLEFKHEFIKPGDIIIDALNNDKLKILDSVFFVKDIVLKGAEVYCILEGEKTGTFSLITTNINYATLVCSVERSNILSKPYFHAHYPVPVSSVHDDNCKSLILINIDDYNSTKNEIESRYKEDEVATRKKQIEEEKARLQKEKEYQQAIIREQSEFRQHMIAKYGAEKGSLVGNHQLAIGMTKEMVRDAWRRPMDTYRTTTKYGQSEVWCYNYKTRVYFYNGIVVQIDD